MCRRRRGLYDLRDLMCSMDKTFTAQQALQTRPEQEGLVSSRPRLQHRVASPHWNTDVQCRSKSSLAII